MAAAHAALREATGSDEAAERAEAEGREMAFDAFLADATGWLRELRGEAAT